MSYFLLSYYIDAAEVGAMVLLPTILTESYGATLSSGKGKKKTIWKPSVAETMSHFIDIQKVLTCFSINKTISHTIFYSLPYVAEPLRIRTSHQ